jgi:hypothetical protein
MACKEIFKSILRPKKSNQSIFCSLVFGCKQHGTMNPFFISRFDLPDITAMAATESRRRPSVVTSDEATEERSQHFLAERGITKVRWLEAIKTGTGGSELKRLTQADRAARINNSNGSLPPLRASTQFGPPLDVSTSSLSVSGRSVLDSPSDNLRSSSSSRVDATAPAISLSSSSSSSSSSSRIDSISTMSSRASSQSAVWRQFEPGAAAKMIASHLDAVAEVKRYKEELATNGYVSPPKCYFGEC